jgi:hypothetical protein
LSAGCPRSQPTWTSQRQHAFQRQDQCGPTERLQEYAA